MVFLIGVGSPVSVAFGKEGNGDAKRGDILFRTPMMLGTISISCASCHPDGQGLEGAYGKAEYQILGGKTEKIEAAVNFWIVNVLRGKGFNDDSREMTDLKAYLKSLQGRPKSPLPKVVPLENLEVERFYP